MMVVFAASCGNPRERSAGEVQEQAVAEVVYPLGFNPDTLDCVEGKVRKGQFFSNLTMHLGLSAKQSYDLAQACDSVFDVRSLRVGNTYRAYYSRSGILRYLVYDSDRINQVIFACQQPFGAWGYEHDRIRWMIQGVFIGVAVKIVSDEQERPTILGTARGALWVQIPSSRP